MARKHRIAAITSLLAIFVLVAVGLGGVYVALGREQPFYTAALAAAPEHSAISSRELESRASALYSETRQPGDWQAAFTEDQINGWLAVQLPSNFQEALPASVSEPRVSIGDDELVLAFRTRRGGIETVATVRAAVMLTEDGCVAIKLRSVHAGALPLPALQVADDISRACQDLDLPVTWTQVNGQAVAIVDIGRAASKGGKSISLSAVELRDHAIYVAGETSTSLGDESGQ